jgi:plasmid stability protein
MPAIHIRNLDDAVIDALKRRAAKNHRSLEGELRELLERTAFAEEAPRRRSRRLQLRTVSVGARTAYGRDEIYGDENAR